MNVSKDDLDLIIKKQDELESSLNKMYLQKEHSFNEMYDALKSMPIDVFNKVGFDTSNGFNGFSHLYNDKEKYQNLVNHLKDIPQYKKVQNAVSRYDESKYTYYKVFYEYVTQVLKDREKLFNQDYLNRIKLLGSKGWFLYFLRTPDIYLFENVDNSIKYIYNLFCNNDFTWLINWITPLLTSKNGLDSTNDMKVQDLTEAINCLINGAYRSCARTLFSLLENEHRLCSTLLPKSKGIDRSRKIDENVVKLEVSYYYEAWEQMNKYFRIYNQDYTKSSVDEVNRNELAHGEYRRAVTALDCLKLVFLLASFKEITFVVRNKIEIEEELNKDLRLLLLKEGKSGKNKVN
jgi:hypothetical protein